MPRGPELPRGKCRVLTWTGEKGFETKIYICKTPDGKTVIIGPYEGKRELGVESKSWEEVKKELGLEK